VAFRLRRPSGLALLALTMLVLLPVLAWLQYRWVGQVSDADRDRMHRGLQAMTTDLTQAIDLELARVMVAAQVESSMVEDDDWSRFAERYDAWRAVARSPRLVHDLLLVDAPGPRGHHADPFRVRRWVRATRTFDETDWPADLASLRLRLKKMHAAFEKKREPIYLRPADVLSPGDGVLLLPVLMMAPAPPGGGPPRIVPTFAFTIARLDMTLLEHDLLPQLVMRHFGQSMHKYDVAVVTRDAPHRVVFETAAGDAAALQEHADVREHFFGIGPEQFPLLRQAAASLRGNEAQGHDRAEPRRNLVFGLFGRRPPEPGQAAAADDGARWTLLVRHPAGSVESAVAGARQRNLALSFGILLLMAGSVALIVVAARRAERLARQQIEFVAAVSHELRTPVAVIGAAADNLAQGVVRDSARVRQYGETIHAEARRLGDTVERVLQFAGIQSGRAVTHRGPVHPAVVIDEGLAACRSLVDEAGAHVETHLAEALPMLAGDALALRSAVQNLVVNAVKYAGPAAWVRVSAVPVRGRRGREVRISVEDRGPGIAAADLPHIGEPFYRGADAVARQIQGNGLGLSIVKHVVQAHGGRLSVASTPGRGSTFTLHLPVPDGEPSASAQAIEKAATA
jgi:signal transduction histidine kinase